MVPAVVWCLLHWPSTATSGCGSCHLQGECCVCGVNCQVRMQVMGTWAISRKSSRQCCLHCMWWSFWRWVEGHTYRLHMATAIPAPSHGSARLWCVTSVSNSLSTNHVVQWCHGMIIPLFMNHWAVWVQLAPTQPSLRLLTTGKVWHSLQHWQSCSGDHLPHCLTKLKRQSPL
jgi:hypothetical protein